MNYDELIKTLKEDKSYWERPIYVEEPNGRKYCMAYLGEKDSFYLVNFTEEDGFSIGKQIGLPLTLSKSMFRLSDNPGFKY